MKAARLTTAMMATNAVAVMALLVLATCSTAGLAKPLVHVVAVDSGRVVVRWNMPVITDGRGDIEAFRVTNKWGTSDSITHARPATARQDTLPFPVAAVGVERSGTVCVVSVRRALISSPGCASWSYTLEDAPPPPPIVDSIDAVFMRAALDAADSVSPITVIGWDVLAQSPDSCAAAWVSVAEHGDAIRPVGDAQGWCIDYLVNDTARSYVAVSNWRAVRHKVRLEQS